MMLIPHLRIWSVCAAHPEGVVAFHLHLLRDHDHKGSQSRTSDTGDGEQLDEASEEVSMRGNSRLLDEDVFLNELGVDIVEIASGLERAISKSEQSLVCLCVTTFLHQPSRRLGNWLDSVSPAVYLPKLTSGVNQIPSTRGTAGIKADPN
jgi:hypothetical protein